MNELDQPLEGTILGSDLDSVYTSYDWLQALLLEDGLRVSYPSAAPRTTRGLSPSGAG